MKTVWVVVFTMANGLEAAATETDGNFALTYIDPNTGLFGKAYSFVSKADAELYMKMAVHVDPKLKELFSFGRAVEVTKVGTQ